MKFKKYALLLISKSGPGWGSRWLGGVGQMASVALLSQYPLTDLTTLAFPQSILCSFLDTCTVILLLMSLLTTACLRSVIRTFSFLLDSPVYTPSQSLQGTWYTISFFFSSGICNFTRISTCFKVLVVAKTLQMLRGVHIPSSLPLSPRT